MSEKILKRALRLGGLVHESLWLKERSLMAVLERQYLRADAGNFENAGVPYRLVGKEKKKNM